MDFIFTANDCPNTFKNCNALYVHRHRKHKDYKCTTEKQVSNASFINTDELNNDACKTDSFDIAMPEKSSEEEEA